MDLELTLKVNKLLYSQNLADVKLGFKIAETNPEVDFDIAFGMVDIDTCNSDKLKENYKINKFMLTQNIFEALTGKNPSSNTSEGNIPVDCVEWEDIELFFKELNKFNKDKSRPFRLPTLEEWCYAAEGAQNMDKDENNKPKPDIYPGFNDKEKATEYGWLYDNSKGVPHSVGQLKPNKMGLYDMCGLYYELVTDEKYIFDK
jgi:formylglycine-generating enzyme required for sulfatase activity